MKVTAILCCAMTMAVLAACSSDDGNNNLAPGVDSRIVGNWLNTNQQALDSNPQNGSGGKLE